MADPVVIKCTMLLELETTSASDATPDRLGGWSESWYRVGVMDDAISAFVGPQGPMNLRAAMLPESAVIIGQRYQQVSPLPAGRAITKNIRLPGNPSLPCDNPQSAILTAVPSVGVLNIRHDILRGLPDRNKVTGEYAPIEPYDTARSNFYNGLQGWCFHGEDFNQPDISLDTIVPVPNSTAAIATSFRAHGLSPNDIVTINGARVVTTNELFRGRFEVTATAGLTFTFKAGQFFSATHGGSSRKYAITYPPVDVKNWSLQRVTERKVGRPFFQFRGRV